MPEPNSRTKTAPGQTPDGDEWVRQEQAVQEQIEKDYLERLRKQQPEASGAAQELRRRYDAREITEAEYLAKRAALRMEEWGLTSQGGGDGSLETWERR